MANGGRRTVTELENGADAALLRVHARVRLSKIADKLFATVRRPLLTDHR